MSKVLATIAVVGLFTGAASARTASLPPGPTEEITLSSLGERIKAPQGNWCHPVPGEGFGCTRAFFYGHPTEESLPVRAGGRLGVRTSRPTERVLVRLLEGVTDGGGPTGASLSADIHAKPADGSRRRWHVRLPNPLSPAGGVAVVVRYRDDSEIHYYARIHSASGWLSVRQLVDARGGTYTEGSVSHLRLEDPRGRVVFERRYEHRPRVSLGRRLPIGRYRLTSYQRPCQGNCDLLDPPTDACSARFRLRDGQRLVARIGVKPFAGCSILLLAGSAEAARTATDRLHGVRFRLSGDLLTARLLPQRNQGQRDTRARLWGKRIRAVCATSFSPRQGRPLHETRRWPKGRLRLSFRFARAIAGEVKWCLLENSGGPDIAAADFEHFIRVIATTKDDRRLGFALRRYLRWNARRPSWYWSVKAIVVGRGVIAVATTLRPNARGSRVAVALCDLIQGSDVADFTPGHTIFGRDEVRLKRCPARRR
jgi:hypothetical protein